MNRREKRKQSHARKKRPPEGNSRRQGESKKPAGEANSGSASGAVGNSPADSNQLMVRIASWLISITAAVWIALALQPTEQAFADGSNAFLCLLALLLPGTWLFVQSRLGKQSQLQLTWGDIALIGFTLWLAISLAWHLAQADAAPRRLLNSSWQWLAGLSLYWLFRNLASLVELRQPLIKGGLILACFLSSCGVYQFFYELPLQRKAYQSASEEEKRQLMRSEGINEVEPNSRLRQLFENRLNSQEPMATFGLANSLAVVISTWLVIGLGLTAKYWRSLSKSPLSFGCLFLLLGVIALCLVLTKSRTAYLATFIGTIGIAIWLTANSLSVRQRWQFFGGVLGLALLLAIVGVVVGTLDIQVLSEAGKSLTYRFEYWQSSLAMLGEHLMFGVGAGNFQEAYPSYKLPTASETVADPHQFVLETATNFGLPAAIFFLAWIGLRLGGTLRSTSGLSQQLPESKPTPTLPANSTSYLRVLTRGWWLGIPAGLGLTILSGPIAGYSIPYSMVIVASMITVPLAVVIARFEFPDSDLKGVLLIGGIALLINLSASGGISFLGVVGSFWLVFSCLPNDFPLFKQKLAPNAGPSQSKPATWFAFAAIGFSLLLAIANYRTHFFPTVQSRMLLQESSLAAEKGDTAQAIELAELAIETDPYAAAPWRLLAYFQFQIAIQSESEQTIDDFETAAQSWLEQRPGTGIVHHELGNWYLNLYGTFEDPAYLAQSTAHYQDCLSLDPNNILVAAQLASNLSLQDLTQDAKSQATKALQMSEQTPHQDLKLENRKLMLPSGMKSQMSAEQVLLKIRKNK